MANGAAYVVCGWYTPDYKPWAEKLMASLDAVGAPHDIVEVEKISGGWERQTMRKPAQVLKAIDRHPTKTILFMDVDCRAMRPLDRIADIRGDIAFHIRASHRGKGPTRFFGRSSVMVFRPTERARAFVQKWIDLGRNAPPGMVDQHTLPVAVAQTPHLLIEQLPEEYCAHIFDKVASPYIQHDNASREVRKIPKWVRYALLKVSGRRYAAAAEQ